MPTRLHGCVIFNPKSGSAGRNGKFRGHLDGFVFHEASDARQSRRLAAEHAESDDLVVAAGGDGTISQVVAGLMSRPRRKAVLGIIPMGTGNDLARTLAMPINDPAAAIRVIRKQRNVRTIDMIEVRMGRRKFWCINAAAGGFTGQMNEMMTPRMKKTWGPLAYLRGAIKVLPDLTRYRTTYRADGGRIHRVNALNIIVANGQTAGGGMRIAPMADPSDGLLDLIIVESGTKMELTGVAARLLAGNYLNSERVMHRRVRRVAIRSSPGMWFNVDGDLIGNEAVSFRIVPSALRVITGEMA